MTVEKKEKVCLADDVPLPPNQIPICYFCEKVVTEDDFCFGCKHFVCQDCDKAAGLIGEHDVDEHEEEDF